MTFAKPDRSRSHNRRLNTLSAPAQIETMESRLLLTAPNILAPTGTIATGSPQIVWDTVENPVDGSDPVSYDLWVSSRETFRTLFTKLGADAVNGNTFTPTGDEELPVGNIRVWVRANFSDMTQSAWSRGHDFRVEVTPTVTGPVGAGPRNVILDSTPTITWTSPPGASSFQVFIRDDTAVQGRIYTVPNTSGDVQEFTVPDDDALKFGAYTAWVRTIYPNPAVVDQPQTRFSSWSTPFRFDYGERVNVLGPKGSTFDSTPVVRWQPVERATEYEIFVISKADSIAGEPELLREFVEGTSFELEELEDDTYLVSVRAVIMTPGKPTVYGGWGSPTEFTTPVQAPGVTIPSAIARPGQNPLVTSANPIIDLTPIDSAARYEIWINRSNSRQPFIRESSSSPSHMLENSLPAGTYFLWARGVSTRGEFGPWSNVVIFDTTGGQPVITSPTQGEIVDGIETTITWTPIEGAATYEIWVDYRTVDFTFIQESGLTQPSYTVPSPLNPGEYRVWVRAMFSDGTTSVWSSAVVFEVGVIVQRDSGLLSTDPNSVQVALTASAAPVTTTTQTASRTRREPELSTSDADDRPLAETAPSEAVLAPPADAAESVVLTDAAETPLPDELLMRLAADCSATTWWDLSAETA